MTTDRKGWREMTESRYRLGHFMLSEHESGALRFATHAAFGMERSGNCYVLGSILVIAPWNREEHGYLINEFHEQRERLPPWEKTDYFCLASSLTEPATGEPPTEELLGTLARGVDRVTSVTIPPAPLAGSFRLGGYRIFVSESGEISWQSGSGAPRLAEGPCRVESGVLLLGLRRREFSGQDGREFHHVLEGLPRWDRTPLWCCSPSLLLSTVDPRETQPTPALSRPAQYCGRGKRGSGVPKSAVHEVAPVLAGSRGSAGTPTTATAKMLERVSVCFWKAACWRPRGEWSSRRRALGKKSWLALAAAGLLIGVVSAGYAVWERASHRHFSHENRHHD